MITGPIVLLIVMNLKIMHGCMLGSICGARFVDVVTDKIKKRCMYVFAYHLLAQLASASIIVVRGK